MDIIKPGTALITGASTGIGAVYADRLAHRGHDLILVARDATRLATLAERLRAQTGRDIQAVPADLTNPGDLTKIQDRLATDPSMTVLVNNAGLALTGGLLDNGPEALTRIIALNVTAPTLLASAAGKAFRQLGAGAIINIASVLAVAPEMFDGVYSGTKAYILNLSLSLAQTLAGTGVHVQAVLPGATRTEIWERSGTDINAFPAEMVMDAGDLVDAALTGFDRHETVTIPPLADESQWTAYNNARLALAPNLSRRDVAARYRATVTA